MDLNEFYALFCAILQEKSVIFLSKNLDCLSSCVLGFQSFLLPLRCQLDIMPIISENHLNTLESSNNFLIGYPGVFTNDLENKLSFAVIVKLDEINKQHFHVANSNPKNSKINNITYCLKDKIKRYYGEFNQRLIYIPNDTQIAAEKKIFEEIQKFISWMLSEIISDTDIRQTLNIKNICENIKLKSSKCNHDFLCNIAKTRAFRNYCDEL